MNEKENPIELLAICAVMLLLSILGIAGGLSTRLRGTLDGLLAVAICLLMAVVFGILLFVLVKECGWIGKRGPNGEATPPSPAK
jgi:CHASE2 domain-containing sensor protein